MDANAYGLIVIMVVLVGACISVFLGFVRAMRQAGSESRRRLIARSALVTWAALAVLTPLLTLSALGLVPRWLCGSAIIIAMVFGLSAVRQARRSTLRMRSYF